MADPDKPRDPAIGAARVLAQARILCETIEDYEYQLQGRDPWTWVRVRGGLACDLKQTVHETIPLLTRMETSLALAVEELGNIRSPE